MPREFSDDYERGRHSEHDEIEEHVEVDETAESAKEIMKEVSEELERFEQEESVIKEVVNELEEIEAREEEEAKEIVEDTIRELQGLEEDLEYKIDEVREELHDEFVNDMESKLESSSLKESCSESEKVDGQDESDEAPASGESYIEGHDGTIYVVETGQASEREEKSDVEVEEQIEAAADETNETPEGTSEKSEVNSPSEVRNSIVKSDIHEPEEVNVSQQENHEAVTRTETIDEQSPEQSDFEESKREYSEQRTVIEQEDVEESLRDESDESVDEGSGEVKNESPESQQEFQEYAIDEFCEEEESPDPTEIEPEVLENHEESSDISIEAEGSEDTTETDQHEVSEDMESTREDEEKELPDEVPEELIQQIEKMLDELESLEDEEVDESRVIIEAMTGKRHIDRSLEPLPYFPETEEDIERREHERIKEKVAALFRKLPEEEREKFKERVRAKLETEEDLDAWIREHSSVKASPDFKQKHEDAKRYIKSRKSGEIPRLIRELWALEIENQWIKTVSIAIHRRERNQFVAKSRVSKAKKQKEMASAEIGNLERVTECETLEDYERLLERHPYLKDVKDFQKLDQRVKSYFEMKKILEKSPKTSNYTLAKILGIAPSTVVAWRKGKRGGRPILIARLLKNEALRNQYESSIPKESLKFRIDPSKLYLAIKEGYSDRRLTPRKTAMVLMTLWSSSRYPFVYAECRPYNEYGPRIALRFAEYLKNNLLKVQEELDNLSKERGECNLRIGFVANKIYLRRLMSLDNLHFDFLCPELFYFDIRWKAKLIRDAMKRLGGIGQFWLSRLVRQLTELGPLKKMSKHAENVDLRFENNFLRGETLQFLLQVNEMNIHDVRKRIKWIGEKKQVRKPQLLENSEFLDWLTRVIAIISSDGTISKDFQTVYCEKNEYRREYVRRLFSKFGIMNTPDTKDEHGMVNGFGLPTVIGRMLVRCGFPVGDKVLQGFSIPDFIMNGPISLLKAYIEEVIPEDGWVTIGKNSNRIAVGIGRTSVLYDLTKRKITSKFDGSDLARLIRECSNKKRKSFNKRDSFVTLSIRELGKLADSKDKNVARLARYLEKLAHENFPQHLSDEQQILEKLGISTNPFIETISVYPKTNRISVQYKILTSEAKYVARLGLLALPRDRVKKRKLMNWMKFNTSLVEKERIRLVGAGLLNEKEESPEGSS